AGGRWPAGSARKLRAARPILLDAVRIHSKQERNLPTVVGVEEYLNLIFAVDIVAIGVRRSDDVDVNLARYDAEVDRVRCVLGQYFGRFDGRQSVDRLILGKAGETRCAAAHRVIEATVDCDDSVD